MLSSIYGGIYRVLKNGEWTQTKRQEVLLVVCDVAKGIHLMNKRSQLLHRRYWMPYSTIPLIPVPSYTTYLSITTTTTEKTINHQAFKSSSLYVEFGVSHNRCNHAVNDKQATTCHISTNTTTRTNGSRMFGISTGFTLFRHFH